VLRPRARLRNVQALRGVAVLLIVGVHCATPFGFEKRYLEGEPFMGWLSGPGQAGVDLFFVISGLIMTLTTWHLRHGAGEAWSFVKRRFKRIYPVYWVVTLPLFAVWLVEPASLNTHQEDPTKPIQSFLLLPQAGVPFVGVGWSLVYEVYFYLVFAGALLAPKRMLGWIIGGWAAVTLVLVLVVDGPVSATVGHLSNPMLLEFAAGVGIGQLVMRYPSVLPRTAVFAGVAVFLASGVAVNAIEMPYWARTVLYGTASVLVVYGAIGLDVAGRLAPRWLQLVGDASYSIYLTHVLALTAIGKVVAVALPYASLHVPLLVSAVILTLALGFGFYWLVERRLLRQLGTFRHGVRVPATARRFV
jgi:peptidoglycan/LPS O-acetylase OafA/YrhL